MTYNFVIDCSDDELVHYKNICIEETPEVSSRGDLCWCLQTFRMLSAKGHLNVICSNNLLKGVVNIIHSHQLLKLKGTAEHFIVCVQADFPKRSWAHYHLVQNKCQLGTNTSYIPLWVQPGLKKRNEDRKGVLKIAYSGQFYNGNMVMNDADWKRFLEPLNIEFTLLTDGKWHDLSNIDVLLGIRSLSANLYKSKPPSKLFNAWHANIPFIGGYDSAYTQVGIPGKDYLRVKTSVEAKDAVLKLKEDDNFYQAMVKCGREKTIQYNNDVMAMEWERILTNEVMARYNKWKAQFYKERSVFYTMQKFGLLQHESKQVVKKLLHNIPF